ncbi:MAG: hypothetical protein IJB45_05045 [Clostridia bacterium]|nr:hypothetical protein [Clostridia bacterium]
MDTSSIQNNNVAKSSKNKHIKIAAAVLCALSVVLIVFLASKNMLFFSIAQSKVLNGEYREAAAYAAESSSPKAQLVSDYVFLRVAINENYPDLLVSFNRDLLNEWYDTACNITENGEGLNEDILDSSEKIKQTLETIFERADSYEQLRPTVLSVMDVFNEINRLYTKDENGKNVSFSVKTEYDRIFEWEQQAYQLSQYLAETPNGESIYLFNYMVKEAEGECSELKNILSTVLSSGYSNDTLVRFSGTAKKTFPDVQNGSVTLNVLDKEEYEKYMYQSLCRSLVENLLVFFNNN